MKCKICGSHKAGVDKLCWKCNPDDRRNKGITIETTKRERPSRFDSLKKLLGGGSRNVDVQAFDKSQEINKLEKK